ncbi:hypothetical protein N7281_04990 [Rickettsia hoogstraalii]|nr:hypothetical protein [Rickettsia hoogstraalii]MCX4084199.1 hypothetical protein [Rickettsia hoogstraalii]
MVLIYILRIIKGDTALSLAAGNGYLDILEYLNSLKKSEIE